MDDEQKLKSLELPTDAEALRRYEMRRRILRALILVLSIIVLVGMVYGAVTQAPAPGEVTVTLEVRYSALSNPFAYFVNVPIGSSLKDALLESGMISGTDGEDGFTVQTAGTSARTRLWARPGASPGTRRRWMPRRRTR